MKKSVLFLLPFMIIPFATSCGGNGGKIDLTYGQMINNTLSDVSYDSLTSLVKDEKTFIITVAPSTNCTCWATFKNILYGYIAKTHVKVYTIKNTEFYNAESKLMDTFGMTVMSDRETFAIFENGKLKQHRVYDQKDYIFKQQKDFEKYMEEVVNLPKAFEINLTQLDSIYASGKEAVIYFARNNCSDCGYVDTHYLRQYIKENASMNNMYILDCEALGIRVYDKDNQLTPESKVAWQNFKDKYGLSNAVNTELGYNTGYVPTFQLIKGNGESYGTSILSMSVTFNDTISEVDGKYVVTDSYYTAERAEKLSYTSKVDTKVLKGLELTADDVNVIEIGSSFKYISWTHKSAEKYHNPLLKAFLDESLPKVTHSFE